MHPTSSRWATAVAESTRRVTEAHLLLPDGTVRAVAVLDGEVTADRTRAVRYDADLTVDGLDLPDEVLRAVTTRLRIRQGIDYAGDWTPGGGSDVEWQPAGTYLLDEIDSSLPSDRVRLAARGLDAFPSDDQFFHPVYFEGGSALTQLRRLITDSVPGRVELTPLVPDTYVGSAVWDQQRWGGEDAAAQQLARALGAEVYCAADGTFKVSPTPAAGDPVSGRTAAGPGGTLLSARRNVTRDGVANLVVARSSASADDSGLAAGELGYALAWDNDPYSPTYLGPDPYAPPAGPFGRVSQAYSSPLLVTYDQLEQAARSRLADLRGLRVTTSAETVRDPSIEPGDVRLVQTPAGLERQVIDGLQLPLTPGRMSLTCRITRIGG